MWSRPGFWTSSCPEAGALLTAALLLSPASAHAQSVAERDATLARGTPREIDFTTDQGTWMSVDISPDGRSAAGWGVKPDVTSG